jgi:nickel-dependent lactate racemase
MMTVPRYRLPYRDTHLDFSLPDLMRVKELDIEKTSPLENPEETLTIGLQNPIGQAAPFLANFAPSDSVSIVVSDSFRQTGIHHLLPTLLDAIREKGISNDQIQFVFSTGTHRGPHPSEKQEILGKEIYDLFRDQCFSHEAQDESNLVYVGKTSRDTPVLLNKRVVESDRIILTGSVVLHYFGGFGGGRKAMVPGLAGTQTIAHNHAMNLHPTEDILDPEVQIGKSAGNPVAEDMLEATKLISIDGIINTVLNENQEIAQIFVGDLEAAHDAACAYARELFTVPITEKADLVIAASAHTKNFVQTHKALFNAFQVMKPDGHILLVCPCPEGIGGGNFEKWLQLGARSEIIAGLRLQSEINGQTALSTREKAPHCTLITEMDDQSISLLGGHRAESLQIAIDNWVSEHESTPSTPIECRIMPNAAYTVPIPYSAR